MVQVQGLIELINSAERGNCQRCLHLPPPDEEGRCQLSSSGPEGQEELL